MQERFQDAEDGRSHSHRRRRHPRRSEQTGQDGHAGRRCSQNDRQRSQRDRLHFRI